jgi:H+/Cl- antiporter ClcA
MSDGITSMVQHVRRASRHSVSPRLVGWSVIVGVVVGAAVSFFRGAISVSVVWLTKMYAFTTRGNWWVLAIVIPISIGLALGLSWIVKTQPLSAGSGIPDVESRLRSTKPVAFPWWSVLWRKVVGGLMAICPGLFLGREGPSVQMGASVGMGLSDSTATTRQFRRELVAAGAAAGLSAAFTAPIAGVLFVAEEIYSRFTLKTGISAFAASLSASIVTVQVFGLKPVFDLPHTRIPAVSQYWQLLVLGILIGVVSRLYEKSLFWAFMFYERAHIPVMARPIVPLLLVIPVGLFMPEALGGGNGLVTLLGHASLPLGALVMFFVVRLVGSQVSYASGLPGGIFLPMLSLGAVFGAVCAHCFVWLGVAPANDLSYIALMEIVGMAGLFGAVSKAPLTAIVLVMEMTSYGVLMPLGVVTLLAYLIYDALGGKPIYDELGARKTRHRAKK